MKNSVLAVCVIDSILSLNAEAKFSNSVFVLNKGEVITNQDSCRPDTTASLRMPGTVSFETRRRRRRVPEFTPVDLFSTRYFFSNSALPFEKSPGYIQENEIGGNYEYSARKNFLIGASTTWPYYGGGVFSLAFRVKYSVPVARKFSIGVCGFAGVYSLKLDSHRLWIGAAVPNAVFTYGDINNNLSISLGYMFIGGIFSSPYYSIAGTKKIGKNQNLVFDSFIVPKRGTKSPGMIMMIAGIRFHTSDNSAFQVGLLMFEIKENFIPFPFPIIQCFQKF